MLLVHSNQSDASRMGHLIPWQQTSTCDGPEESGGERKGQGTASVGGREGSNELTVQRGCFSSTVEL